MIPANLYPLFQHMNYTHNLTLLESELQEIRDVVRLGDTIPTTTKNDMTTAIEKLKEAVAKVRRETGESYIRACVDFGGGFFEDEVRFQIYRDNWHSAGTLDEAVAKAIAYDKKAAIMAEAAALRARAAELEAGRWPKSME